jgi:hypothetical protein
MPTNSKEYMRNWYQAHPKYFQKYRKTEKGERGMRDMNYKRSYGISVEDYEKMLIDQCGLCACCGNPPNKRRLCVDHNHETLEIRELVCDYCNIVIGIFENSSQLEAVKTYLERHNGR